MFSINGKMLVIDLKVHVIFDVEACPVIFLQYGE